MPWIQPVGSSPHPEAAKVRALDKIILPHRIFRAKAGERSTMKRLTTENWLDVDPIIASGVFVRLALADGTVQQVSAQDWTARLLAVHVSPDVPEAVRDQIEISRAAMIYGSL